MTATFAVGRMVRNQPRFYAGEYDLSATTFSPMTTGHPDKARAYESRDLAEVIAIIFNALDGQKNWVAVELPEAWL